MVEKTQMHNIVRTMKKRERTQNWIPEEKKVLFSLIKIHAEAIENKKVDSATSVKKAIAWRQIHSAFCKEFATGRDVTRMREQWRRMKAQTKIEIYAFANKVESEGLQEAVKFQPSILSIQIWLLSRKTNNEDIDRRDETNQQVNYENSPDFYNILKRLVLSASPEMKIPNCDDVSKQEDVGQKDENILNLCKSEVQDDFFDQEELSIQFERDEPQLKNVEENHHDISEIENLPSFKRKRIDVQDHADESIQQTIWSFKMSEKEHQLRLEILKNELERTELQKKAAYNELKTSEINRKLNERRAEAYYSQIRMIGERGSGAGKGGGGGGSIREAGGSFGKMEAAQEDQYFYNQQKEQLKNLKDGLHDEISFHEEQIKRHQEAITRHKSRINDMDKE